jgi:pimeloyl-ACP methyl ester carboxylesterase
MTIHPFTIHIPQEHLDDLHERLRRTRWPDQVRGAGWDYGANLEYMQGLVDYWLNGFDWRAQEKWLNTFPQFMAGIDGLNIHFIHQRGKGPDPIPIILTHGWPSSFMEMLKLVPLLTDPGSHGGDPSDAFDVVVPSVPGFGFSEPPLAHGMNRSRVASLWLHLMDELGFKKFGAHANDIGAVITSYMARQSPQRFLGFHTLMPTFPSPAFGESDPPMSLAEKEFANMAARWDREEGGYNLQQETRPQTLGYGLNDSPVGLAAWIIEKWRAWGALNGDLENSFSMDELLTNVSIYWFTQTANSAGRSYYERAHDPNPFRSGSHIHVPTGVALTLEPVQHAPREWVERVYTNILHWTEFNHGGHFLALEDPQVLASDLREFFRPLRLDQGST